MWFDLLMGAASAALWDALCHAGEHPKVRKSAKCVVTPPVHKPWICDAGERSREDI